MKKRTKERNESKRDKARTQQTNKQKEKWRKLTNDNEYN